MDIDTLYKLAKLVGNSMSDLGLVFSEVTCEGHRHLCDAYEKLNKAYEILDREVAVRAKYDC